MLKIKKVFNNNAVLVENESLAEFVVLGKGIAFGKKAGEHIDENAVEKTFNFETSPFVTRLTEILSEIPAEYFRITNKIVNYANQKLEEPLANSIFISLTDHIYHAVQRIRNNQPIANGLLYEIKRLYKTEYEIGERAVAGIKEMIGVDLGEDEAGFIALHIVNARTASDNMADTMRTTQIVRDILHLVSLHFNLQLDESTLDYSRFVTHLQYFAQRLFSASQGAVSNDDFLYRQTRKAYPKAFECVEKIDRYLQKTYQKRLNQDEQLYLTIHIQRVIR